MRDPEKGGRGGGAGGDWAAEADACAGGALDLLEKLLRRLIHEKRERSPSDELSPEHPAAAAAAAAAAGGFNWVEPLVGSSALSLVDHAFAHRLFPGANLPAGEPPTSSSAAASAAAALSPSEPASSSAALVARAGPFGSLPGGGGGGGDVPVLSSLASRARGMGLLGALAAASPEGAGARLVALAARQLRAYDLRAGRRLDLEGQWAYQPANDGRAASGCPLPSPPFFFLLFFQFPSMISRAVWSAHFYFS